MGSKWFVFYKQMLLGDIYIHEKYELCRKIN